MDLCKIIRLFKLEFKLQITILSLKSFGKLMVIYVSTKLLPFKKQLILVNERLFVE